MNQSAAEPERKSILSRNIDTDLIVGLPCPFPTTPRTQDRLTSELCIVLAESGCPLASSVEERLQFETFLANLSATFVNVPASEVDAHIESGLRQIVEFLDIDRSGLGVMSAEGMTVTHSYQVPGVPPAPRVILETQFPSYARLVHRGQAFRLPEDLPPEASLEREFCVRTGLKSNLTIPLRVMGGVIGGIGFASFRSQHDWSNELIQRLRLVGDIFANALARKRADEALQRATEQAAMLRNQLAHATRVELVSHLTTSIAHEVNQPLCAISSNAQTAVDLLDLGDIEEAKLALHDICADARRASEIIGRVRSLVRNETPSRSSTRLASIIEELAPLLHREASVRGVDLRIEQGTDDVTVDCDRVQLQQVLLNLLLNAAEAVAETSVGPSSIVLRVWEEHGAWARVSVADTGPGLSEADCERVFATFFTTKAKGLGMGLSICRSLIAAHGGSLWATPGAVHGTSFHVQLPLASGVER